MTENIYKPKILIVDDVPENLQVLYKILADEGYSFSIATNGAETFEVLEKQVPDIILLDIILPDINGFDICARLKVTDEYKNIPVIFLTAKSDFEDKTKAFNMGAVDFVTKPFEEYEVLRKVSTQIKLKRISEICIKYQDEDEELKYWINK